jgi:hypothetical protein
MADYFQDGSELGVNTTSARTQAHSDLTRLADGRLLAVWIDADFNTTAGRYLRGQLYAADGTPLGGELTLATDASIRPDVVGLPNGGFALTYIGSGVRAQLFDADANPVAPSFYVKPGPGSSLGSSPEIAALAGGGIAVIWDDEHTGGADASGTGVRLSTYDALGNALLTDVVVNSAVSGNQADASVSGLANGGFAVTWTDRGPRGAWATAMVKAQLYDASGARVGGEFLVSDPATATGAVESAVTALTNGNFAVAWYDNYGQHVQVFTASGQKVGTEIVADGYYAGIAVGPAIAALADGGFAVAFQSNSRANGDGDGSAIFVQAYDALARAAGETMRVNTSALGNQIDPAIVGLADGGFMVNWTDLGGGGADDDEIRAQIFRPVVVTPSVEIASNGAGGEAAITLDEGISAVTQVAALATNAGDPLVYSISGGADAALFAIDSVTGALAFAAAPDHEYAADADGDNVYDVVVTASAGALADSQALSVTVANVNEGMTHWSGGVLGVGEGETLIYLPAGEDVEGDPVTFAITGGADAALFTLDSATKELRFITPKDYEAPASAAGTNSYSIAITASDGSISSEALFEVRVKNVDEPLSIVSNGGGHFAEIKVGENQAAVTTVQAHDPDGGLVGYRIHGGADAALFTIDELSGELRFLAAPDYEAPADADGDNRYEVTVQAGDGTHLDAQALLVEVVNGPEPVEFTSFAGAPTAQVTINENATAVATLSAVGGAPIQYSIVGGADAARFKVDPNGALRFAAAPDHEAPGDTGGDNRYEVLVEASDGTTSDTQLLSVTVADLRDGRTFNGTAYADSISPSVSNPALRTTAAEDTVYAQGGNDMVEAGAGEDRIDAGAGNDTLVGGAHADQLIGGSGADLFVYTSTADSKAGAADQILDFSRSQGDRIHLGSIDANPYASGDQSFAFIGSSAFTGGLGQLRVVQSAGDTNILADLNGDRVADLHIVLEGTMSLTSTDFVL